MAVDPLLTAAMAGLLGAVAAASLAPRAQRAFVAVGAGDSPSGEAAPIRRLLSTWVPALFAALLAALGALTATTWGEILAWIGLASGLAWLVVIDLASKRLPDALVAPLYPWLALWLAVAAWEGAGWPRYGRALLAGLVCLVAYFALAWIAPWGLGLGDVKLSGVLGMAMGWFGWDALWMGVTAGFITNALVGVLMLALRRGGLRSEYPYGPHMVLGAVIGIAIHVLTG